MSQAPAAPAVGGTDWRAAALLVVLVGAAGAAQSASTPAQPDGSDSDSEAGESAAAYDPFLAFDDIAGQAQDAAEPVFEDRVIAPGRLAPLPPDEFDDPATFEGPPRAFHVEAIASRSDFVGERTVEFGAAFGGHLATADWGDLSADALLFSGEGPRGDGRRLRGSATLWQRGLRLPGGWSLDNGLGVLNTPMPTLLRDQYRFILPSVPMLGASTEWRQSESGLTLQAALGRGGGFGGFQLSGFEFGDGSVFTAAAQRDWSLESSSALGVLATDGRIVPDEFGVPEFQNGRVRALLGGHRWQRGRDSVQLNALASDNDGAGAGGLWVDARSSRGGFTHRYGLFRLEPELAWGAWPINNDVQGGYYRVDFNRGRVSWNAALDRIDSITGGGFEGWYGSGYLRYQHSPRFGYGGALTARRSGAGGLGDGAETMLLFVDGTSDWGQTRLQYDRARDESAGDSWQVLLDHALRMREGSRLSVAAGTGELAQGGGITSRTSTLAAYGGFDITTAFSVDGSVRATRAGGVDASEGIDLNIGWRWRLAPRWMLLGSVIESRGERRSPFVLDPLAPEPLFITVPNHRSVFLSLRYDFSGGRPQGVLGGLPGAASGHIAGSIFLDDNGDGVRGATEQPAANVTVLLDGRFSTRTDASGRFRFERVAVGARDIEVVPDNLPLPWTFEEGEARRRVQVDVRQDAIVDIGAVRQR